jgi:type I restriction enzyme S subunit
MADDRKPKEPQDLPEGWKWVKLGEVIEEVKERKGRRNISTVLTVSNTEGLVDQTEFFGRNLSSQDTTNYKVVYKGCFVYNPARINVGSIALNDSYEYAIVSPMYCVFRTKECLLPKYLSYWIQLPNFKHMVINNTAGSVRESLNFSRLITFDFPLPPLPEQRKIAQILETVDNAIEKTEKIIEKYKRIKQGLMQDLLTKGIDENGNIRSEKTHKFKDSPLGRIPEEWEVGYVSDFAEINPITKINPKELYPFIEMDATPIMGKQCKYITLRRGIEAGSKFKKGDILLARITPSAENGKALLVPDNIEIGIGSTEFIVFRAKENIDNNFLFYLLISDYTLGEKLFKQPRLPEETIPNSITLKVSK